MALEAEYTKFHLPGFNLPVNFAPGPPSSRAVRQSNGKMSVQEVPARGSGKSLFWNALHMDGERRSRRPVTTTREFTMLQIMNSITDKPNWNSKVFDEEITAKWKAESMANADIDVSEPMMKWIIDELRFKAKIFQETGAISVYDADVVKSDSVVSESLREELRTAAARLEDVPEKEKDYHPNSDDQVLDLVHPSLFPLIYGRTRIVKDRLLTIDDGISLSGQGEVLPRPERSETPVRDFRAIGEDNTYSREFQWLPCDVAFQPPDLEPTTDPANRNDFKCQISSYINNLHPNDHGDLYKVVEQIIACAIPLWNMSLTALKSEKDTTRIAYDFVEHDMPEQSPPPREEDEEEDEYKMKIEEWIEFNGRVIQPEPGPFKPDRVPPYKFLENNTDNVSTLTPEETVDLHRDFAQTGLQVIVKLANIHLTPEKPEYPGGSWHVEGQMNEHICATALYYYDSENITESRLSFRQECNDDYADISYQQNDHRWFQEVFSCSTDGSMVQPIGDVVCKEGRLLTFPNALQHCVQPFRLADPTRPGHRKILALFLVDPNIRIISTAHVPSQRKDWWERIVTGDGALGRLPRELQDQVVSDVEDFPISMEEAKRLRLELMEERKTYVSEMNREVLSQTFSLCEH